MSIEDPQIAADYLSEMALLTPQPIFPPPKLWDDIVRPFVRRTTRDALGRVAVVTETLERIARDDKTNPRN